MTVVLPEAVQWRGPRGVRVHRARLTASDVIENGDGVRHTAPLRTAWDVALLEPTGTAVGVLDAMVSAGTIQAGELGRCRSTTSWRPAAGWRAWTWPGRKRD